MPGQGSSQKSLKLCLLHKVAQEMQRDRDANSALQGWCVGMISKNTVGVEFHNLTFLT